MLRLAFGYLAIAIVVAVGFSSLPGAERSERRVAGPAAKHSAARERPQQRDGGDLEYVVEAGPGGHYLIEAVVNGAPVDFLVDTGASDIVLTLEDAERLGLQPETLRFTQRFATANGEVRGAPVVLREIRIGQFSMFEVPASVNEAPLGVSLLGMSFLGQLNGYQVEEGRLVLRW
ncbi:MAG TPA: TIGR02281 family clan AA aspartic protease [Geminicoccaceae bacterium]